MCTKRILKPGNIADLYKVRSNVVCDKQKIKRNLFGPVKSLELHRNLDKELEKYQNIATKKWGFDFRSGKPLNAHSQYKWERISPKESSSAPDMYSIIHAAHVRFQSSEPLPSELLMDKRANLENSSSSSEEFLSDEEILKTSSSSIASKESAKVSCKSIKWSKYLVNLDREKQLKLHQTKITQFMKKRKRPITSGKSALPPAKVMRPSTRSMGRHLGHHRQPHSLSAHFSFHLPSN